MQCQIFLSLPDFLCNWYSMIRIKAQKCVWIPMQHSFFYYSAENYSKDMAWNPNDLSYYFANCSASIFILYLTELWMPFAVSHFLLGFLCIWLVLNQFRSAAKTWVRVSIKSHRFSRYKPQGRWVCGITVYQDDAGSMWTLLFTWNTMLLKEH